MNDFLTFPRLSLQMIRSLPEVAETLERRLILLRFLFHFVSDCQLFYEEFVKTVIKPNLENKKFKSLAFRALAPWMLSCDFSNIDQFELGFFISSLSLNLQCEKENSHVLIPVLHALFDVSALFCKTVTNKKESNFPIHEILKSLSPFLFYKETGIEFSDLFQIPTISAQGFAKIFLFDPHYASSHYPEVLFNGF